MTGSSSPVLDGIHHIKIPVTDLNRSCNFYERSIGAVRLGSMDHLDPAGELFAVIMQVPGTDVLLELRLHPVRALLQRRFDPITIAVPSRGELERWVEHLHDMGVETSPVLSGMQAWLLAFRDPDGTIMRLYSREMHGPEVAADFGSPWLSAQVLLSE